VTLLGLADAEPVDTMLVTNAESWDCDAVPPAAKRLSGLCIVALSGRLTSFLGCRQCRSHHSSTVKLSAFSAFATVHSLCLGYFCFLS
jgi:hypothetical protein